MPGRMFIIENTEIKAAVQAASILSKGGIAVIPTDTVYGMAVDPGNSKSVQRLYRIKQREPSNPLARFFTSAEGFETMEPILPLQVRKCARSLLPGPLTLVIENRKGETTGIRIPDNPTALEITSLLPFAPAVTSVNVSGSPPLTSITEIMETFGNEVDIIIDAGDITGAPSSVAGFLSDGIRIIREGNISGDTIMAHSAVTILFVCSGNICRSTAAEYYCRKRLSEKYGTDDLSRFGFTIESAGTFMLEGNSPPEEIITIMEKEGIDVRGHTSQPLYPALLEKADIVYTMDASHTEFIRSLAPQYLEKAELLDPDGQDIPDPYQKPFTDYVHALARIKYSVSKVAESL